MRLKFEPSHNSPYSETPDDRVLGCLHWAKRICKLLTPTRFLKSLPFGNILPLGSPSVLTNLKPKIDHYISGFTQ